jgi:predicted transcriptional regulator
LRKEGEGKTISRRVISPRSRWEIILNILRVISEEERESKGKIKVKKTRIMQKAHLDWKNFQKHFNFLLEHGFVGEIIDPEEGMSYELTEKGRDVMRKLRDVERILR